MKTTIDHFPTHIAATSLRPDLVVWSDVQIEPTCCFESGFEEARKRKENRYSELGMDARMGGYRTTVLSVQIGSRGVLEESCLIEFN